MIKTKQTKSLLQSSILKPILAFTLVLALIVSLPLLNFNQAGANVDDLKKQQEAREQELQELNRQISDYQRQINANVQIANTLQNQIALYTAQINQAEAQIQATNLRLELVGEQIEELNLVIAEKEAKMIITQGRLAELIRKIYELDASSSALISLMNNDNLSDFLNSLSQIQNVQGQTLELLQEVKRLKAELESKQAELEEQRTQLNSLQADLRNQRQILQTQRQAKDTLLAQTRGNEQEFRRLLAASQAQENQIEREIRELENQIRAQLGHRVTPGEKGLFVWPMRGTITQRYGNTGFTALGYNFHNGIDVAAAPGTPIVSAYDGVINGRGSGEAAYGNWLTIRHDLPDGRSIVTLYAHLMGFAPISQVGAAVKAGQVIGTQGNTGNTTRLLYGPHRGFHLHFTVFDAEGFRIVPGANPARWGPYQVPTGYTYDPMDFL